MRQPLPRTAAGCWTARWRATFSGGAVAILVEPLRKVASDLGNFPLNASSDRLTCAQTTDVIVRSRAHLRGL
jgi:hypothetical protein